ncbi:M48 family metalloprotease [Phenylobacterium parvum]|uniref:Peptidase M48 n=1 Tax=Phenylobacterium parvum TaxID=2201350 RepID=A0A2Z3HSR5_9CAUL|nr:M48 family metalloprotease [Phenylobacterium parvum]AWM77855.1 peptidase M48 [Phenylobacterium parvum]
MTVFDPATATATYLATLDAASHARATAYTQGGHWILLWTTLVGLAVLMVILRSGVLVRLRDRLEARGIGPLRLTALVLGLSFGIEAILNLPWSIYADWSREKGYGLTSQALSGWLAEYALVSVLGILFTVPMGVALYALIRRSPRFWWAWSGALVAGAFTVMMVVAPVLIDPLFNQYKPAPPGPVRDAVVALAKANGVPSDRIFIYDGSRQSNRYTANVSGLMGSARIAMSDVMFKKDADIPEVRAVVGHEMGHYVLGHVWRNAIVLSLLAVLGLFLVDRLFSFAARLLGAPGVRDLADPAGYPVIAALLLVLGLASTPVTASLTRIGEIESDRFSLERAREPDGLARALVKTIEYRAATPGWLEEVLFYTHPSVGSRVRMAMDWKAAHKAAPMPVILVRPDQVPQ